MEKLIEINSLLPYGYELLVRNNKSAGSLYPDAGEWFVHFSTCFNMDYPSRNSIYKNYGNDLIKMIDEVYEIVINLDM